MEQRKKSRARTIAALVFLALFALFMARLPSMAKKNAEEEFKPSILTGTVERRDLERVLSVGGSLSSGKATAVSIPDGVKLTELLKHSGDTVKKGDVIALVDRVSVMTAVTEVQNTLDELRNELNNNSFPFDSGALRVEEDGSLYAGSTKIEPEKYADYAEFLTLSEQHREYEEIMQKLFQLYQSGAVTAPADGMLDSLDTTLVKPLAAGESGGKVQLLAGGLFDFLLNKYYVGVVTETDGGSYTIARYAIPFLNIPDSWDPNDSEPDDTVTLTITELDSLGYGDPIVRGDMLLMEYDARNHLTNLAAFGHTDLPEPLPTPTPTPVPSPSPDPDDGGNTDPDDPGDPDDPDDPDDPGGKPGHGGWSGFVGWGSTQQTEPELFSSTETLFCTVVPLDSMTLSVTVDEQDVHLLSPGMTAPVTLDALPRESFTGTVSRVIPFGSSSGGSSKFTVELTLPYSEGMLPGMNGSVSFVQEKREAVLCIPVKALDERNGRTVVYTGYDEKTETLTGPVEIVTAFSDGEYAEIVSGAEEGASFTYAYYDTLHISSAAENRRFR